MIYKIVSILRITNIGEIYNCNSCRNKDVMFCYYGAIIYTRCNFTYAPTLLIIDNNFLLTGYKNIWKGITAVSPHHRLDVDIYREHIP